ncbi:MAG: hypothetical protein E7456_02245 [Ruminococcaceae bacterium]|nr:hypothetical protein [Oscillospiraceae bacterium]
MKNKFNKYYIFSVLGTLLLSCYPIYMGIDVIRQMVLYGTVMSESYPKYIIPYTPICIAILAGVLLMPIAIRLFKKLSLLVMSVFSTGVFFLTELILENTVIITDTVETTLESWQMYMCYVPRETVTVTPVEILIGEYSPTFKLHFYIISIVLILSVLNCFYGFGMMIKSGDKRRAKHLVLQTIASILFLALCIFACFTAFFRTGELTVSPISAVLMGTFFIVFGVTMGIYTGSFFLGHGSLLSLYIPAAVASLVTFIMYIGEMILLNGELYRFDTGIVFSELGSIILAPVDIFIILLSGVITVIILKAAAYRN